MTGPISGFNPQQSSFSTQNLQQGNTERQDRVERSRDEAKLEQERIQVKGTATSEQTKQVDEVRSRRDEEQKKTEEQTRSLSANANQNTSLRRGSLVDVVV